MFEEFLRRWEEAGMTDELSNEVLVDENLNSMLDDGIAIMNNYIDANDEDRAFVTAIQLTSLLNHALSRQGTSGPSFLISKLTGAINRLRPHLQRLARALGPDELSIGINAGIPPSVVLGFSWNV